MNNHYSKKIINKIKTKNNQNLKETKVQSALEKKI